MHDLISMTAVEAVRRLRGGEVSPLELIDAAEARIAETDGAVNALPTLCFDRARNQAETMLRLPPEARPMLQGLPIAVKDLNPVAGVRTTFASPIYADHVPDKSDYMVEVIEREGAVTVAKSNTPEFGAGASTFNEVFGRTRNPWDTRKSVAGSSGGAAASLAAGQVWLATGSDFGGSLRTPASFCGVVGLRPTPGRVPHGPDQRFMSTLSVNGPMGRTVADTALFLDAMVAGHPKEILNQRPPEVPYLTTVERGGWRGRVAVSRDLGLPPVDRRVIALVERAAQLLADTGQAVEEAEPGLAGVADAFHIQRAIHFATVHNAHYERLRDRLKPDIVWNIEAGREMSAMEYMRGEQIRARLHNEMLIFFDRFDVLLCPAAPVPPFDVDVRYVDEIEGQKLENYIQWLAMAYPATMTGCPAISVPVGFSDEGLPIGVQIIAAPTREDIVLQAAKALEDAAGLVAETPRMPNVQHNGASDG